MSKRPRSCVSAPRSPQDDEAVRKTILLCSHTINQTRAKCRAGRTLPPAEWLKFLDQQEAMVDGWNKQLCELREEWRYFKEHAIEGIHTHAAFNAASLPCAASSCDF